MYTGGASSTIQEATIRPCYTIQKIIEAQINPEVNLTYREPPNQDCRKIWGTRRTSFADLRAIVDAEVAEPYAMCWSGCVGGIIQFGSRGVVVFGRGRGPDEFSIGS
jgi:hypothetical protein